MCIYIASRLSTHPTKGGNKDGLPRKPFNNADIILGYMYNLRESLKAAAEVWKKGHYPFVPGYDILLYLELDDPSPRKPYDAGFEWVRRCDAILIVNGLEDSTGVQQEYGEAIEHRKLVFFSTETIPEVTT